MRGIIILGSLASVNDELPWQAPLVQWLKQHWEVKIPTLGICFGHQLIAKIFGGKVGFVFEDQHKIVGARHVTLVEEGFVTSAPKLGKLGVSHCEEVKEIPNCLEVFAQSSEVKFDGLVHRELPIWTLQAHPEALPSFFAERKVVLSSQVQDEVYAFGHSLINDYLKHCATPK
jgi:GMP synthase-like glutamine amidotransferase